MDINDFRIIYTVLMFIIFIGIVIWAYHPKNKTSFEKAAQLPLDMDDGMSLRQKDGNHE